jgi:uncharacterized protein (UPF0276 family)
MSKILSSIACNLDANLLSASLPLLEQGQVEAIEWSFDTLFNYNNIPDYFNQLLQAYSSEKRLIGHGVFFSIFSGKMVKEQHEWLQHLKKISSCLSFDHITEHFGFMTGGNFHSGAPLTIPYTETTLKIGQDRITRIYDACRCPVGLENLAFASSLNEVKLHGSFLEELIEPVNGFVILDLHNLYCQMANFEIPFNEIINLYPLKRVREIHISGGSWKDSELIPGKRIRRDTHDDSVPSEVFQLLEMALEKCPQLKYVVLEQLGTALMSEASKKLFRDDFIKMKGIVDKRNSRDSIKDLYSFLPDTFTLSKEVIEDELLYRQQLILSDILENCSSLDHIIFELKNSTLANSDWKMETWDASMIETASKISKKWKQKK